ncbi:MAG: hypothetical protein PQJ60_09670 [Spirochaetales bacterium]|nr:hypothetical protein [Spirochaetales bacterium]
MENSRTSWSWADQISTYRFWGILLFALFLSFSHTIITYLSILLRDSYDFDMASVSLAQGLGGGVKFLGLWSGWFLIKRRDLLLFYIYAACSALAFFLFFLFPTPFFLILSSLLSGFVLGGIALAVPALISGGRGGREMFLVSFGLISLVQQLTWSSAAWMSARLFHLPYGESKIFFLLSFFFVLAGIVCLIPVNKDLFQGAPPERSRELPPQNRDPLALALMGLIPLYNLYHIPHVAYRLHGEVSHFKKTGKILSPRAAVWCTLLLPLIAPMILCSLNSVLISLLEEKGRERFHKNGPIIFWSFLFIPAGYALIQSNLNLLLREEAL